MAKGTGRGEAAERINITVATKAARRPLLTPRKHAGVLPALVRHLQPFHRQHQPDRLEHSKQNSHQQDSPRKCRELATRHRVVVQERQHLPLNVLPCHRK